MMYSLASLGCGDVLLGSLWGSFVGSAVVFGSDFGSADTSLAGSADAGSDLGSAVTSLVGSGSPVGSAVVSLTGSAVPSLTGSLVGSAEDSVTEGSAMDVGSGSAVVEGSPVGSGVASSEVILFSLPEYLQHGRDSLECKGTLLIVYSC